MAEADPQTTFNVHDAKTQLSRLIDRAHSGEEIVLAKAGVPHAKIVAYATASRPRRVPGRYRGQLGAIPDSVWFDPLPDDELDAWDGKYSNIV